MWGVFFINIFALYRAFTKKLNIFKMIKNKCGACGESSLLIYLLYTGPLLNELNIFKMIKKTNAVHMGSFLY